MDDSFSVPGVLHRIPPFSAFEPTRKTNNDPSTRPLDTLLWIGGLGDTYLSTKYPYTLAQQLPSSWSLVQLCLSSSGSQYGWTSLEDDASEMEKAVSYFRSLRPGGKIVVMGHSTGSQDALFYATTPRSAFGSSENSTRPAIDGIVLQAAVSDRQAVEQMMDKATLDNLNEQAKKLAEQGKEHNSLPVDETFPIFGSMAPLSAKRWLSLASPDHKGQDDLFSSDLSGEQLSQTFGKIPSTTSVLVLYSGSDESVPKHVDKEELLRRWAKAVEQGGGKIDPQSLKVVEGASHTLNHDDKSVVEELCTRVNRFLQSLVGDGVKA